MKWKSFFSYLFIINISSIFQVRDGSISSSPLLGTYCGNEIPPRLQSTQKSMYIRFKTDSSVSNHGFEAAYGSALEGENSILIQYHQSLRFGTSSKNPLLVITDNGD